MGVLDWLVLSDAAWERMAPLIIGRPDQKGSTGRDNRMFVEGVLWIVRTGAPWRDLPERYGPYTTVYNRFNRWARRCLVGGVRDAGRTLAPVPPSDRLVDRAGSPTCRRR